MVERPSPSPEEQLIARVAQARGALLTVVGDFDPAALPEVIDVEWGAQPQSVFADTDVPWTHSRRSSAGTFLAVMPGRSCLPRA